MIDHDAMRRMGKADVLIAGMRGLGVEIAKNVILAGVRSVTIQDEGVVQWRDLSSQVIGPINAIKTILHLNEYSVIIYQPQMMML